ncbi:GDSL esterase/lipase At5g45920-like [Primulina eburnea]|uniref:GDSL esterase/lipase At5g45920-like n=1 Tax=Primulina eburnea TaxID=1245227 RepID=UPI003C6C5846
MRPKIYLFGDSITEGAFANGGWGSSLANHFSRTADVVLRGYSGYNTRWALKVKEKVLHPSDSSRSPAAVVVFFGANDACLPDRSSAFQHVPLEEYKQNLHAIVAFLKKQWPSSFILLITPPPIDEAARLLHLFSDNPSDLPERTNEAAGNYAKACLTVASECGVAAIDLWTKMQQFPGWKKAYLVDGLHLTENGNDVVFEEVVARLREEGMSLESLPVDQPLLSDINPKDPLKSFENDSSTMEEEGRFGKCSVAEVDT